MENDILNVHSPDHDHDDSYCKKYFFENDLTNTNDKKIVISSSIKRSISEQILSKKEPSFLQKIFQIQNTTAYKIFIWIFIFILTSSLMYSLALSSYYKNYSRTQPQLYICSCENQSSSDSEVQRWKSETDNFSKELLDKINSDEWKFYSNSDGVKAYNIQHENRDVWKFNGTLPGKAEEPNKIYFDRYEEWPTWDSHVSNATILKTIDPNTKIGYHSENAIMGINRDFFMLIHKRTHEQGHIYVFKSVYMPEDEYNSEYLRGTFETSGAYVTPLGNHSFFQFIFDVDLFLDWVPFRKQIFSVYFNKKCQSLRNKLTKEMKEKEEKEKHHQLD